MPRGSKPGERRGGRRKGTRNKITAAFKDAVLRAFDAIGGDAAFAQWAEENKTEFYKIAARLMLQEMHHGGPGGGPLTHQMVSAVDVGGFTDEELAAIRAGDITKDVLSRIAASAHALAARGSGGN